MKGISTVIATILMLMLTIALAGMAYMYISGIFTSRTSKIVEIDADASRCNRTHIFLYIRNIGTVKFDTGSVNIARQGYKMQACNSTVPLNDVLPGGNTILCTPYGDDATYGVTSGFNTMVVTPGSGGPTNSRTSVVYCP
jgi:flagellin-like protein